MNNLTGVQSHAAKARSENQPATGKSMACQRTQQQRIPDSGHISGLEGPMGVTAASEPPDHSRLGDSHSPAGSTGLDSAESKERGVQQYSSSCSPQEASTLSSLEDPKNTTSSSSQLLTTEATLNGVQVEALVDTGASHNFINKKLVEEHGWIQVPTSGGHVRFGNNTEQDVMSRAQLYTDIRTGKWSGTVDFLVANLH